MNLLLRDWPQWRRGKRSSLISSSPNLQLTPHPVVLNTKEARTTCRECSPTKCLSCFTDADEDPSGVLPLPQRLRQPRNLRIEAGKVEDDYDELKSR